MGEIGIPRQPIVPQNFSFLFLAYQVGWITHFWIDHSHVPCT
jgi:hypothetical protein